MQLNLENQSSISLMNFALTDEKKEVGEIVQLFMKASHKKGQKKDSEWLDGFEIELSRLNEKLKIKAIIDDTLRENWIKLLNKIVLAITLFEQRYNANCPCASFLPSPFLKRLVGLQKKAMTTITYL